MSINCYCISSQFADVHTENINSWFCKIFIFIGQCDCCTKRYCCYLCGKSAFEDEENISCNLELENKMSYSVSVNIHNNQIHSTVDHEIIPNISTKLEGNPSHETIVEDKEIDIFQERQRVGTISLSIMNGNSIPSNESIISETTSNQSVEIETDLDPEIEMVYDDDIRFQKDDNNTDNVIVNE